LGDQGRYNLLPTIAKKLNLNMKSKDSLWKDRALIELNIAVLYSFRLAGVTIVDHHTVSNQFLVFEEQERKAHRRVFGDWGWLVPPMSGSTMEVFHRPYENRILTPNFFYQPSPCTGADTQAVNSSHQCPFAMGG
jgi:nitric-oxide synthase